MTIEFKPNRRRQVEAWLGRSLTSEELIEVASIEVLSAAQLDVVNILARRQRLACLLYLEGVVEDITGRDGLAFIDRIRDTPMPAR